MPAALDLFVWRYASRRKSSSIRWASVVTTRSGSWAACAAMRWSCGVTVGDLKVSPVGLSSRSGCPASPSLPWVLWACVPHLHRDYAPLRLPPCPSRVASLVARFPIPCVLPWRSWCPIGARTLVEAPRPRQGLRSPGPPLRECRKETGGSPKFPSHPYECMHCSQTTVVSSALALLRPGLLPSGHWKPSAFSSIRL